MMNTTSNSQSFTLMEKQDFTRKQKVIEKNGATVPFSVVITYNGNIVTYRVESFPGVALKKSTKYSVNTGIAPADSTPWMSFRIAPNLYVRVQVDTTGKLSIMPESDVPTNQAMDLLITLPRVV